MCALRCAMCVLRPPNERIVFNKYLPVSRCGPEPSEEYGIHPKMRAEEPLVKGGVTAETVYAGEFPKWGPENGHTLGKRVLPSNEV